MPSTKNSKYCVVGIGEVLWDMLPDGKRLGGAPANFALHCKSLAGQSFIVSAVGQEPFGDEIIDHLSQRHANTDFITKNTHPTGRVDVELSADGHPTYVIHENSAWDNIELTPEHLRLAASCDAVCFGSLAQRNPVSQKSIHEFLSHTGDNCLRIFDINLRQHYYSKETITHSLQAANILKLNDDELIVLHELMNLPADTETALKTLIDEYQLRLIALTQGGSGSILMNDKQKSYCPSVPVTVKDTIGAGDSFTATMTMATLHGLPLESTHRLATKVAAYVCSQSGATPELPEELTSELIRCKTDLSESTELKSKNT